MKLYLASLGIVHKQHFLALLGDLPRTVAIIPNAWDVYPEERRQAETQKAESSFAQLGFFATFVDLTANSNQALRVKLNEHSVVWVMGGNTFYLNYVMRQCGFAEVIADFLKANKIYGGESAGAAVATPTIHGIELFDNLKEAPETLWEGLGLVDFGIVPHWGLDKYAGLLRQCKREMSEYVDVITLTDNQAILVDGDKSTILG